MEMEFSEEIRNYIITLTLILIFSIILDIDYFSSLKNRSILTNISYLGIFVMIILSSALFITSILLYLVYIGKIHSNNINKVKKALYITSFLLIVTIILDIAIFSNSKNGSILTNISYLGQSLMITSTIMAFILFIIVYLSYKGKYLKVK
jgi:hypothetical protein